MSRPPSTLTPERAARIRELARAAGVPCETFPMAGLVAVGPAGQMDLMGPRAAEGLLYDLACSRLVKVNEEEERRNA